MDQEPPLKPVSSKKYKQLVYDSTQQLHQSLESILLTLDQRALGLTKCANFDAALGDANVMQEISPSSALGYLRAAMIYSEQGKQRHVVDICDRGLNNVDTKDLHYDSLQRTKASAKQRDNQRIDFISQLPADIVITKLIPLFMHDNLLDSFYPHPYMNVSHRWCDRIIQCFGGLSFMLDYEEDRNVNRCSQVIPFAQNTKALCIAWYSQGTWLSDLLCDNDFCSLQELHINSFASNQIESFISSLNTISNTLMDFSVTFKDNHTLSIADIVSTCTNLRSLSVIQPYTVDVNSLPMTLWHNMTTLSLTKATHAITLDQIVDIWKRFPSLKYLRLGPCADLQSVLAVSEYCPSMTSLELLFKNGPVDITYSDSGGSCEEQGITDLSVYGYLPNNWNYKELTNILNTYRKTLGCLKWGLYLDSNHNTLYDIQYMRLKKLVTHGTGWWIPRNAPKLEELYMTTKAINSNTRIFDTIPPHLKTLEMRLDMLLPIHNTFAIQQYLHQLSQHSPLKEIVVYFSRFDIVQDVLDGICRLSQLERLMLDFTHPLYVNEMDQLLCQLAEGCPRLSCLEIKYRYAPLTSSIHALKRLEHLKQLAFSVQHTDSEAGFWEAIESFSQLKCIRIHSYDGIDMSKVKRLQEQRPDMKVIVDQEFTRFS